MATLHTSTRAFGVPDDRASKGKLASRATELSLCTNDLSKLLISQETNPHTIHNLLSITPSIFTNMPFKQPAAIPYSAVGVNSSNCGVQMPIRELSPGPRRLRTLE